MLLFKFLDLFGTAVFAISGAFAAARKGMDITGVLFLAFVVGIGGGTIRDMILQNGPVFWITQHSYIWVSFIAAIASILFARFFIPPYRFLLIADALGLGVFSVIGTEKALAAGRSDIIAIMMGMLTCTGGSLLRDLICNEIPLLLQKEIYATAALIGSVIFLVARNYLPIQLAIVLAVITTFIIRIAAIYFDWGLPAFSEHWFAESRIKNKGE